MSERPLPKKQGSWWVIGRSDSGSNEKEKDGKSDQLVVAKSQQAQITVTPKDAGASTFHAHIYTYHLC